jgi:molybdate/tungstate transport system permease protein
MKAIIRKKSNFEPMTFIFSLLLLILFLFIFLTLSNMIFGQILDDFQGLIDAA